MPLVHSLPAYQPCRLTGGIPRERRGLRRKLPAACACAACLLRVTASRPAATPGQGPQRAAVEAAAMTQEQAMNWLQQVGGSLAPAVRRELAPARGDPPGYPEAAPQEDAVEAYEKIVRDAIAGAPFARKLGIVCELVAVDRVVMRLPWTHEHTTIGDLVHGGAIAALVDVTATGACWATLDLAPDARGTTIGFSLTFLNAGRAQDLLAEARVVQRGRSIITAEVDVRGSDGKHVARALVTYKKS